MAKQRSWIIEAESQLAKELREELLASWMSELNASRIILVSAELGIAGAIHACELLGRYELDEELAKKLRLDGVALGTRGEVAALSPVEWPHAVEIENYADFRERVEAAGGELQGLRLTASERRVFSNFVKAQGLIFQDAWQMLDVARHFFFGESLKVVVAYTEPRFNRA